MLTPFYLLRAPERVIGLYSELEEYIIHDIARRLAKTGKLTGAAAYQAARAKELGTAKADIAKEVAYTLNASEKYISQTLYAATMESLEADDTLYKKAGKNPTSPRQSRYIQNYVKAISRQTQEEMKNFTRSMGFQTTTGFKKIAQYYQHALDFAHLKITTGATDYNTAIRQAVKEISDSGLRFVDYKSGWVNHADVAVRRAVLTGIQQTAGHLAEMRADEMGISTMEITAHAGARPSHAVWQGQIVDRSGQDPRFLTLDDIGYGAGDGFKGWNCRHDWAPFIPGISVPSYTQEQLKNIDPPPVEYNGKTYTYYEATQRQRQIETAMRKTKRELIAYDGAGDKDMFTAKSILLRRQREEYAAFSKAANIRPKMERTGVLGYGHSTSGKAVWAERKYVQNSVNRGIINYTKPLRVGNVNYTVPIDKKELEKHLKACARQGIIIQQGLETDRYLRKRNAEGITLNEDTSLLMRRPTRSSVFEETIHRAQYRKGKMDGSTEKWLICEIEAQKKLIKYQKAYKISDAETAQTKYALKQYRAMLEEYYKGSR